LTGKIEQKCTLIASIGVASGSVGILTRLHSRHFVQTRAPSKRYWRSDQTLAANLNVWPNTWTPLLDHHSNTCFNAPMSFLAHNIGGRETIAGFLAGLLSRIFLVPSSVFWSHVGTPAIASTLHPLPCPWYQRVQKLIYHQFVVGGHAHWSAVLASVAGQTWM
jgi:hypothetical protein